MDTLHEIREYVFKTAFQKGLLFGDKIDEIELPSDITHQLADRILADFHHGKMALDIEEIKDTLLKGFVYMFDKGVELSYFSRLQTDSEIEYNFGDLLNGISGDTIPIYLQEKVNSIIVVLADIYSSSVDFIKGIEPDILKKVQQKELIRLFLVGGAFLGVEYCLRIELE